MKSWKDSLAAKSLVVVSIPVAIQLLFLGQHNMLLSRVQEISEADYHAREVIGRTNYISTLLAVAHLTKLLSTDKNLASDHSRIAQTLSTDFSYCAETLPREIQELANTVKDNDKQLQMLESAQTTINRLIIQLDSMQAQANASETVKAADLDRALADWHKLRQTRSQFLRQENTRISVDQNALPEVRKQQEQVIMAAEIFSVSAAIITLIVFIKGVASRLWIMTENTEKLLRREPLAPPLSGSDEVAILDRKFHEMADELHTAEMKKQEYLLMLSHDMRSPLTSALASAELIATDSLSESQTRVVGRIQRGLENVLSLINNLLDIERLEAGAMPLEITKLEAYPLLERAAESVRTLAEQKEVKLEIEDGNSFVTADAQKLVQVLINLLANSIKFSPHGSTIKLTAKGEDEGCRFSVSDNGRGIPPEKLSTIFNRFAQTKQSDARVGSGLGLAICKALVDVHGGEIGVSSKEGRGTEFYFVIPDEPKAVQPMSAPVENSLFPSR